MFLILQEKREDDMRALIQRVKGARVKVADRITGEIGHGLLLFLGIKTGDTKKDIEYLADKIINLRIFEDENGKMNLSMIDTGGSILVVSQFTLYGNCDKGRRPSFTEAAPPDEARKLYEGFCSHIHERYGILPKTGEFAAMMEVELTNDGPVTFMIESRE